ncbi:MAG: phosphoribosyltransferase [Candidatus Aminicenantes bacterium]|nr:phosphoribosyltransferase [Candidatus Aminicenantes bacterium]
MFKDREEAGRKLAKALGHYKDKNVLVLAIPRGGVEVGFQVAKHLNSDFSILICRKLPYPDNPEAGFGALAEDGSTIILKGATLWIPEKKIKEIIQEQREETQRRIDILRKGNLLPEIEGKTIILVDDGLAMGSTMRAAIELCRKRKAKKIVVAVPVAGDRVSDEMNNIADEAIILEIPPFFRAVAQVYMNWYDVQDKEVLEILEKWETLKQDFSGTHNSNDI